MDTNRIDTTNVPNACNKKTNKPYATHKPSSFKRRLFDLTSNE